MDYIWIFLGSFLIMIVFISLLQRPMNNAAKVGADRGETLRRLRVNPGDTVEVSICKNGYYYKTIPMTVKSIDNSDWSITVESNEDKPIKGKAHIDFEFRCYKMDL